MCGIVGYVGWRPALPILLRGLEQLEYRGYDSAGVACFRSDSRDFFVAKEKGKLHVLKSSLNGVPSEMYLGLGHTRWATHGEPSKINAHPHLGPSGRVALVHNGIIENYAELKANLTAKGHRFLSMTDTEVAAHLIERCYRCDFAQAIREAIKQMKGFFAFAVISRDEPGKLFAFRRSNPLVIGVGRREHFVASDISALLPYTKKVIYLEDNELAKIEANSARVSLLSDSVFVTKPVSKIRWTVDQAQKNGFPHFMLKEIHEQPRVLEETLRNRISAKGKIRFDTLDSKATERLKRARKIFVVSCGTAYHAGLTARYMIEEYGRIPVEAHVSSEFRYADPILTKQDVVILITQSGETADTLAALREAKSKGALTLAIVNVVGSTIAREADNVIYTHAGPEIGVASTKAYLAQLISLALLAIHLGILRKQISSQAVDSLIREARKLPAQAEHILKDSEKIIACAKMLFRKRNFLYLGRGYNYPNALEGALKLKEITYAHAHGYAAGEMKHGPIALIDEHQPVVCLAPFSKTYEKMISNIQEIQARRGIIISIVTKGDKLVPSLSRWIFSVPKTSELFSPILTAIPLQLFAYQVAVLNHRDVDQPRNLAKSVTVE